MSRHPLSRNLGMMTPSDAGVVARALRRAGSKRAEVLAERFEQFAKQWDQPPSGEIPSRETPATAVDGTPITIKVVEGPTCPCCGGREVLLGGPVRPFKIHDERGWQSHCTSCDVWFLADGTVTERNGVPVTG